MGGRKRKRGLDPDIKLVYAPQESIILDYIKSLLEEKGCLKIRSIKRFIEKHFEIMISEYKLRDLLRNAKDFKVVLYESDIAFYKIKGNIPAKSKHNIGYYCLNYHIINNNDGDSGWKTI